MGPVVTSRPTGSSASGAGGGRLDSPPANRRANRSRHRGLRLFGGIALVVGSILIGSWFFAAADTRVTVWAAARDLAPGTEIRDSDLVQVPVRLDAAAAYIGTESDQLIGLRLSRPIGDSELVPLGAVEVGDFDHRLITIPVEPMHSPPDLGHGDRVDVYLSPREAAGSAATSTRLVLAGALVSDVADPATSVSGESAVVLDVSADQAAAVVSASRGGVIDLVRLPMDAR